MSLNKMGKGSEESKGWSGEDFRVRRGGASVQEKEIVEDKQERKRMEKAKWKMLKKVVEDEMDKEDDIQNMIFNGVYWKVGSLFLS